MRSFLKKIWNSVAMITVSRKSLKSLFRLVSLFWSVHLAGRDMSAKNIYFHIFALKICPLVELVKETKNVTSYPTSSIFMIKSP